MYKVCLTVMQSLKSDRRGVTAIEYGLLATLIAVALVGTITAFETKLATVFTTIGTSI